MNYHIALSDGLLCVFGIEAGILLGLFLFLMFDYLKSRRPKNPRARRVGFFIRGNGVKKMSLKVDQKAPMFVSAVDKKGNPVGSLENPVWSLSDPALAALVPAADGLSALLVPAGALGEVVVKVEASSGGKLLSGELSVSLEAGAAASLSLSLGEAVDQ